MGRHARVAESRSAKASPAAPKQAKAIATMGAEEEEAQGLSCSGGGLRRYLREYSPWFQVPLDYKYPYAL